MPRCAVLGDPIAHSLSPTLHRAGYVAVGLDWEYDAHRVDEAALAGFLDGLDGSWRGLSLTMPLKRQAVALADEVTPRARLAGVANTLVLTDRRLADNTDTPGAVAALRERYAGPLGTATILGAGATAASLGLALADLGVTRIRILGRSPERSRATVDTVAGHPSGPVVEFAPLDPRAPIGGAVVSTIPAEAQTDDLVSRCAGADLVFEALYHPWPTPLARAAQAAGTPLVCGLDLLVHQAAVQFELFTEQPAPLAAMRAAGEAALASR